MTMDRDLLGRVVRDAWVKWASEQPDVKPGWLVPWDDMPEGPDKEVDRLIGEAVEREVNQWIPVPPVLPMSPLPIPSDDVPVVEGPLPEEGATVLLSHAEEGWLIVCVVRCRRYFSWPRGSLEFVFISEVEKNWSNPMPIRGTHWRPRPAGPNG